MSRVETANELTADIAVVGLGPVGLSLCALLGARGVAVIGIDPLVAPVPFPRAIAVDDETLRTLLTLPGVRDTDGLFNTGQRVEVRDAYGRLVTALSFDGGVHGVPGLSFFHQPSLEQALRQGLEGLPNVRLCLGRPVLALRDAPGGVRLELDGPELAVVNASWAVGCDGGSSFVRQQRGIGYGGRTFAESWVVVDVDTAAPLPHLPYFTYVMDRHRPSVNGPRPGGHRFEFMLRPGERPQEMVQPDQVRRWLHPYLDGSSVGRQIETRIVRSVVYEFHARIAERWRDERVLLAGDAAHSMPPFGGQGLAAGVGDALALAWRLDEVRRGLAGPSLLDDYERDRRPRASEMITTALNAGRLLTATSLLGSAASRSTVRALDRAPVLGPRWRSGAIRGPASVRTPSAERRYSGGRPLPNPRVRTLEGRIVRLDELLERNWTLIGRGADPLRSVSGELRSALQARGCRTLVATAPGALASVVGDGEQAVEDLDGWLLSLWNASRKVQRNGDTSEVVALVRPDRFLAGVGTAGVIETAFDRLTQRAKGTFETCASCSPSGGSASIS